MSDETAAAAHATAVVVREAGVLIRGAAGAGKTSLALLLLDAATRRGWFARLVGDDRLQLRARHGALLAAPHRAIAGLVEHRGRAIVPAAYEPCCRVALVVDIMATPLPRLPEPQDTTTTVATVTLPLLRWRGPPQPVWCAVIFDALAIT